MTTDDKLTRLREILGELGSVAIAFSGGVDSTFLLKVGAEVLGDRVMAVTAISPTYPPAEFEEAKRLAADFGVKMEVIDTDELNVPGFQENRPNRCYFCKRELFTRIRQIADREAIRFVADGANVDDVNDFRPGLQAAEELGVRSPLREAGLAKQEIRDLSRALGLPTWDKPAFACLASRFPYGDHITEPKLAMVAQAEDHLRHLGLKQCRVRHHGPVARIEVPAGEIEQVATQWREKIVAVFKEIGFTYVTLDLQGYRTGSMNEVL